MDSPNMVDFFYDSASNLQLWHFAQWLGRPLAYRAVTSAICKRLAQGALPDIQQPADFGRVFFLCQPRYGNGRQNCCVKCQESSID
jgi:hypothetical protein